MNFTKKNVKQIMKLIVFAAVVFWCALNYKLFIDFVFFGFKLVLPIIVGIAIAFVINVPMKQIERKIFKIEKRKHKKPIRVMSLLISIILIVGIIGLLMFLIIPEFIQAISSLSKSIPKNLDWIRDIIDKTNDLYPSITSGLKDIDYKDLVLKQFDADGNIVKIVVTFLSGLISRLVTVAIGFIIAIYVLFDKENLARQVKKFLMAFFPDEVTTKTVRVVKLTNTAFTNFLTGQCLDACLFGIIFFIFLTIFKMPYALIISVLLAVTALIPYIGAFITLVVGVILIAVTSPTKAIMYVVLFFVLQQFDDNIMYPRVVGKQVGLPPLLALVAVIIGGSIFGFLGMIISIPLASILFALLKDQINIRLKNKEEMKK